MYQTPQSPQQSIHMTLARLPQVMPKMKRGIIQNSPQRIVEGNYQQMRIVKQLTQYVIGIRTAASGNNSYTPTIETVTQIKFKKLPFYEVIKPTLLTGTDKMYITKRF